MQSLVRGLNSERRSTRTCDFQGRNGAALIAGVVIDGEIVSLDYLGAVERVDVHVDLQSSEAAVLQGYKCNFLLVNVSKLFRRERWGESNKPV